MSSSEPPLAVPPPKPPGVDINYNDPIEVYMRYQEMSWTGPRQGGPTLAM